MNCKTCTIKSLHIIFLLSLICSANSSETYIEVQKAMYIAKDVTVGCVNAIHEDEPDSANVLQEIERQGPGEFFSIK